MKCDGNFPEKFDASWGIPAQALRAANAAMCDVIGKREWDVPCTAKHIMKYAETYSVVQVSPNLMPGWQLVPTKHEGRAGLTHDMADAFYKAFYENGFRGDYERLNAGYNAMLAAAPRVK